MEIHPGVYAQIRDYAELVDRVLVTLRRDTTISGDSQHQLALLLTSMGDKRVSAQGKLLEWVIKEGGGPAPHRLCEMGRQLSTSKVTAELLGDLESLARALERERATAFAKMQGR